MKKLFLFFIDGIGLGPDNNDNPVKTVFSSVTNESLIIESRLPVYFKNGVMVPTDACLGVEGIPQSATGQATIFTGVNASAFLGYHLTAIPNEKLVDIIKEKSLMKVLREKNISVTSANLYSKEFFQHRVNKRRNKFPVSTLTIQAADVPFRCEEEYKAGRAVFADITNQLIRDRGYTIDLISPRKAGKNLLNILSENQFVFFEYFMTDTYAHKRNIQELKNSILILSRFLETIWESINKTDTAILVVSDHGNAEVASSSDHSLNKVPTILFSPDRELQKSVEEIHSLTDIYPWILGYFD